METRELPTSLKNRWKVVLAALAVLLVLCVSVLPVLAASENVEDVLAQLARLQRVDVDPGWRPDVTANQQMIQQMLDAYNGCSASERAEFTEQQNADLRAYFEALYAVQGRDAGEVDDIFAGRGQSSPAASSSSRAASSSRSASSSSAPSSSAASSSAAASSQAESAASDSDASSQSLSQSQSEAAVSVSSRSIAAVLPVESDSSASEASLSSAVYAPQMPRDESFLSNAGLGGVLLMALGLLLLVIAVVFLVSLRKAGRPAKVSKEEVLAGRELYGENYEPDESAAFEQPDDEEPQDAKTARKEQKRQRAEERRQRKERKRREKELKKGARLEEQDAWAEPESDSLFGEDKKYPFKDPLEGAAPPQKTEAEQAQAIERFMERALDLDPIEKSEAPTPAPALFGTQESKAAEDAGPQPDAAAQDTAPQAPKKKGQESGRLNPGKQVRPGRPGRMPFSQGDSRDLDAIDD